MARFREEAGIETIYNACPICHSDVKGNDQYLYFCASCNILFRRNDLVLTRDAIDTLMKERVAEKFSKEQLPGGEIKTKSLTEKKKKILEDIEASKKYYMSKKSNILHVSNCPYGKNIKRQNKLMLRSLNGLKNYKKCRCMESE